MKEIEKDSGICSDVETLFSYDPVMGHFLVDKYKN